MRRFFEVLALLTICAAAAMMLLRPPEVAPPSPAVSPDPGPYTILGVRPGMPRAEVEALLGPGRQLEVSAGVETTVYGDYGEWERADLQKRWATVTWKGGTADFVRGSHLHRDGREVLGRGWNVEDARKVLGESARVSEMDTGDFSDFVFGPGVHVWAQEGRIVSFALESP